MSVLDREEIEGRLAALGGWDLSPDGVRITCRFEVKGFLRAQQIALLAGTVGDLRNHHPDIRHGWGYCEVDFTSHDAGGVTERDLTCAAALNAALGE